MKKIGFFGGSFNPPTIAHFEIVKNSLDKFNLDKVIIVPMGDKYKKDGLISFEHRYNMLCEMFKYENNVEISRMQADQKEISYAVDSFKKIDSEYRNCERFFIMGLDNFSNIETWKDGKKLILNRKFIIFERKDYAKNDLYANNISFINVNNNISSSLVRNMIRSKADFQKFIMPEVASYIIKEGLYK